MLWINFNHYNKYLFNTVFILYLLLPLDLLQLPVQMKKLESMITRKINWFLDELQRNT